jgi:membrane protease YdiL (CAAX protease family)
MTETTPPAATSRSIWSIIFLSPNERRLRAGWRLTIQTFMMIVLLFVPGILVGVLAQLTGMNEKFMMLASEGLFLFSVTASVFLCRWWFDRRPISSLGLKFDIWTLSDLLIGIAIPFAMMGFIFMMMTQAGWLEFHGFAWETAPVKEILLSTGYFFVFYILVGWTEELLSRGYHLQTLASGTNLFWGVLISSSVFGVMHLGNPNSESKWMVSLGILLAGVFLAFGFLRTKQLWLPIGLHIGWNFFEGPVFGFPVSGMGGGGLLKIAVTGPDLFTGGKFGPESGLVIVPALLLGAILIYIYTIHREHLKKID